MPPHQLCAVGFLQATAYEPTALKAMLWLPIVDLQEAVLMGVAHNQQVKDSLAMVFERRIGPYDTLPFSAILAGLGRALHKRRWQVLPQFLAQGKRVRSVKNQLRTLQEQSLSEAA